LPLNLIIRGLTFEDKQIPINMLDVLLKKPGEKHKPQGSIEVSERVDKPIKSIMKTVSWRIVGTLDTMIISYFITGTVTAALSIGTVEVLTKTILYYFHERLWANIHKIKLNLSIKTDGKQYKIKGVERSAIRQVS